MEINLYQREAFKTANKSLSDRDMLANGVIGLAGESGEIAEIVKKHLYQGHDFDKNSIKKEIGDVMWYVALICTSVGVDLGEILDANIAKLRERYGEKFESEKSIHRIEKANFAKNENKS